MELNPLIIWLVGAVAVPLLSFLKKRLNLEGKPALALVASVSVIVAVAALFISGDASLTDFNWSNLAGVSAQVFAAATVVYKLLAK